MDVLRFEAMFSDGTTRACKIASALSAIQILEVKMIGGCRYACDVLAMLTLEGFLTCHFWAMKGDGIMFGAFFALVRRLGEGVSFVALDLCCWNYPCNKVISSKMENNSSVSSTSKGVNDEVYKIRIPADG